MGFDVSKGAAYAILYSILVFFTILAIGTMVSHSFLPGFLGLKNKDGLGTTDYFLAARNSAGAWAIALSFFAR